MPPVSLDSIPDFTAPRLKRFFASPHQCQIGLADSSVVKLLRQLPRGAKVLGEHEGSSSGLRVEITLTWLRCKHATNLVQAMNGVRYFIQMKVDLQV